MGCQFVTGHNHVHIYTLIHRLQTCYLLNPKAARIQLKKKKKQVAEAIFGGKIYFFKGQSFNYVYYIWLCAIQTMQECYILKNCQKYGNYIVWFVQLKILKTLELKKKFQNQLESALYSIFYMNRFCFKVSCVMSLINIMQCNAIMLHVLSQEL